MVVYKLHAKFLTAVRRGCQYMHMPNGANARSRYSGVVELAVEEGDGDRPRCRWRDASLFRARQPAVKDAFNNPRTPVHQFISSEPDVYIPQIDAQRSNSCLYHMGNVIWKAESRVVTALLRSNLHHIGQPPPCPSDSDPFQRQYHG